MLSREAPAVVLEPPRQVLRLGRAARVRKLRDHLAVAGDRFVVAIHARQRARAVELRRRRLVARQMLDGAQQQLAGRRVVAPHVELRHPDLVVALGGELGRQRRGQLGQLGERLVPVAVLGQRLGAAQPVGGRQVRRSAASWAVSTGRGGVWAASPACRHRAGAAPRRPAGAPGSRARWRGTACARPRDRARRRARRRETAPARRHRCAPMPS